MLGTEPRSSTKAASAEPSLYHSVIFVCVFVCTCMSLHVATHGGLRVLGPLELELQGAVSHLVWVLNPGPLQEQ